METINTHFAVKSSTRGVTEEIAAGVLNEVLKLKAERRAMGVHGINADFFSRWTQLNIHLYSFHFCFGHSGKPLHSGGVASSQPDLGTVLVLVWRALHRGIEGRVRRVQAAEYFARRGMEVAFMRQYARIKSRGRVGSRKFRNVGGEDAVCTGVHWKVREWTGNWLKCVCGGTKKASMMLLTTIGKDSLAELRDSFSEGQMPTVHLPGRAFAVFRSALGPTTSFTTFAATSLVTLRALSATKWGLRDYIEECRGMDMESKGWWMPKSGLEDGGEEEAMRWFDYGRG
ncbi:hypothetical protein C8R43DRAFT_951040 [Mycena crocata]|nr:hypothetical protein C8R43DRAFT_951040 [Mycena crocata]